jgi:hypothetical protein
MAVEGFDDWLQRRADPAIDCSGCGPSAGLGFTIFRDFSGSTGCKWQTNSCWESGMAWWYFLFVSHWIWKRTHVTALKAMLVSFGSLGEKEGNISIIG